MLTLPIKRMWFDMIASGEKKEEYREIKEYYDSRLLNAFGAICVGDEVLHNVLPGKKYYILHIKEIDKE